MTPEVFADRMEQIYPAEGFDPEFGEIRTADCHGNHNLADDLLCEALKALGYGKGIEIFEKAEKWYS